MKLKCIICLLIVIFTLGEFGYAQNINYNYPPPEITAKSAILVDYETGKILFEKNSHERLPLASITKIMTLIIVCEFIEKHNINLSEKVIVSQSAASMGGSQIYLKEGEQISIEELLKSVAVASANDAAVALAEYVAGSEQSFVYMMNKRAQELSMHDTNFTNACGLDEDNHYSSAFDIAIMSKELLKHKWIQKYLTTWMDTIRNGSFGLTNTNKLVRHYKGTTGVKTGFTDKAKFCISASAMKMGLHLICVIMGAQDSKTRFSEATKLLDWGFGNFVMFSPVSNNELIGKVKVKNGLYEYVDAVAKEDIKFLLLKGEDMKIKKKIKLPNILTAPIKKGQKIGSIVFLKDDEIIGEYEIVSNADVKRKTLKDIFPSLLLFK